MAIAERKSLATPSTHEGLRQDGPRAKSLRPYERSRAVRPITREVLAAFEAAVLGGDELRIRVAAGRVMDELLVEARQRNLPEDLVADIERWDEGEFRGSRADVELANWALAAVLDSPVRTGLPETDDDELLESE